MAAKLVALVVLCLPLYQAASLPVDQIVDSLQSFLTAPEQAGLRLRRSTDPQWDKELDLESLGLVLKLKYNDPSNLLKGGRAHVKFPGSRFVRNLPFDDVDLDIEFNGGDAVDGLFDMKVDYKFKQTFSYLAARPQEGSFVLYRKLEGGMWKTRMTIDNNNKKPKPFLDIGFESDRKTKLNAVFNFEEDNKWEMKAVRVPGKSIALDFILNGVAYTGMATIDLSSKKLNLRVSREGKSYNLDFDLNPAGEWGVHVTGDVEGPVDAKLTMQPDFKMGQLVLTYKGENYAFMQIKGEAEMAGLYPKMADYVVKYNIIDGHDHNGKAKVKFDIRTSDTKFLVSVAPQNGAAFDYVLNLDFSNGIKYLEEFKKDTVTFQKSVGDYKWTNDNSKFELETKESFQQTKENPFFVFNTKYLMFGREALNAEKTQKIFFNKVQKNKLFNQFKVEAKTTLDGKVWYDLLYDTTIPKMVSKLTWLPSYSTEAWQFEGQQEYMANGGFSLGCKIVHGDHTVHEGEAVFDVKENSAGKFEMDIVEKVTWTKESPFYWMGHWVGYPKTVEEKTHISVDKTAMLLSMLMLIFPKHASPSMLIFPKTRLTWEQITDGKKFREVQFDTTQPMRRFSVFWTTDRFSQAYDWEQTWEVLPTGAKCNLELKRGDITILKYNGEGSMVLSSDKFELKTVEKAEQTEDSPVYSWGPVFWGKYWHTRQVKRTLVYNRNNRNIVMGKTFVESDVKLDGQKHLYFKFDTTSTPYTMVLYSPVTGSLTPNTRNLFGKDELTIKAWHTAGKELKIETNLDQAKEIKITTQGATRKFELNGKEYMSVTFDASAKTASTTIELPNGEKVTLNLAWPRLAAPGSDIVVDVVITPNRKLNVKLGFEQQRKHLKVQVDAIGANPTIGKFDVKLGFEQKRRDVNFNVDAIGENPTIGDYKFSRKLVFGESHKEIPGRDGGLYGYDMRWTGQDKVSKGPLAAFSPMDTNVQCDISTSYRGLIVCDAWKTYGGKKMGFKWQSDTIFREIMDIVRSGF